MKLLCINDKYIKHNNITSRGAGLKEGETYITKGKPYAGTTGDPVYYIEGLGAKLCCRFTELLDERDEAERESDFAIEKLKEEFQLN